MVPQFKNDGLQGWLDDSRVDYPVIRLYCLLHKAFCQGSEKNTPTQLANIREEPHR